VHEDVVQEGVGFAVGDVVLVEKTEQIDLADGGLDARHRARPARRQRVGELVPGLPDDGRRIVAVLQEEGRAVGRCRQRGGDELQAFALAGTHVKEQLAVTDAGDLADRVQRHLDLDVGAIVELAPVALCQAALGALRHHRHRGADIDAVQRLLDLARMFQGNDLGFHVVDTFAQLVPRVLAGVLRAGRSLRAAGLRQLPLQPLVGGLELLHALQQLLPGGAQPVYLGLGPCRHADRRPTAQRGTQQRPRNSFLCSQRTPLVVNPAVTTNSLAGYKAPDAFGWLMKSIKKRGREARCLTR